MDVSDQIALLQAQHADLERKLTEEHENLQPDPALISDIKKQKLRIKDQIAALDAD